MVEVKMRSSTIAIVMASLLAAGTAAAAEGKGGSEGGKGGAGPGGGPVGPVGGGTSTGSAQFGEVGEIQPDILTGEAPPYKPWEVGAIWETHRLIRQNDLAGGYAQPGSPDQGQANNKFFNEMAVYARYDLTDRDRVGLRTYFYQRFLADQGETGFRTDDLIATYTRLVPLPERFRLQVSGWLTAPISYDSQVMGLITAPRIIFELDRRFGPVTLDFRTYDEYYVQKYTTYNGSGSGSSVSGGASPTPWNRLAFAFEAEFHMPFYEPLSVGADVYTAYTWYHNINYNGNTTQGSSVQQSVGAVQDPTYSSQPIQQIYGGEVFLRYLLPPLAGIKTDLTVALAQGDPTLGYTGLLHDGVEHGYLFYRQNSEVYGALAVRY